MVDPPVAATPTTAFSSAARDSSARLPTPRARVSMTIRPHARATSGLRASVAGTSPSPSGAMPRSAIAVAIVFAVNCPPHAPAPGQARSSSAARSPSVMRPAAVAPTASNTSWMVTSRPAKRPGRIGPP